MCSCNPAGQTRLPPARAADSTGRVEHNSGPFVWPKGRRAAIGKAEGRIDHGRCLCRSWLCPSYLGLTKFLSVAAHSSCARCNPAARSTDPFDQDHKDEDAPGERKERSLEIERGAKHVCSTNANDRQHRTVSHLTAARWNGGDLRVLPCCPFRKSTPRWHRWPEFASCFPRPLAVSSIFGWLPVRLERRSGR